MVSILTDSCCDLSQVLLQKYSIDVIPLHVQLGDKSFKDGEEISRDDLFKFVEQTGTLPKTSAVSVEEMKDFFSKHGDLIYIGIGSKLSATIQAALLAKEETARKNIKIVDSQNLSTGIGLLVLKAAELQQSGKTLDEIETEIIATAPRLRTAFVIDTLDYLYKGGRCSALANFVGSMLHIRPVIAVRNGAMSVKDKISGSRKKALDSLLVDFRKNLAKIDLHRVFITHTGCDEDAAYLHVGILEIAKPDEINITYAGATITSHCGPNTIGILYIEK